VAKENYNLEFPTAWESKRSDAFADRNAVVYVAHAFQFTRHLSYYLFTKILLLNLYMYLYIPHELHYAFWARFFFTLLITIPINMILYYIYKSRFSICQLALYIIYNATSLYKRQGWELRRHRVVKWRTRRCKGRRNKRVIDSYFTWRWHWFVWKWKRKKKKKKVN